MNIITIDNNTYSEVENFAKLNNTTVSDVVKASIHGFLKKFNRSETVAQATKYELPEHLKKMRGIVAGEKDENDDRLNYLLEKNK